MGLWCTVIGALMTGIGFALSVVAAFRQTVAQGVLTVLVPGYVLYFVIARSGTLRRVGLGSLWLAGLVLLLVGGLLG